MDPWEKAWKKSLSGAVAVVDCREEIPCNPCEDACRKGAIVVGDDICTPPSWDPEICDGCGRCVSICPGMAVFLLDRSMGGGTARVTVPYEMPGDIAAAGEAWVVDGKGNPLGKGKIVETAKMGKRDRTVLVTLEVPEDWALKVRGVRIRVMSLGEPDELDGYRGEEECYLCRCEEVTDSRVRELAGMGFHALGALRRFSRVGLGYCQGRFCQAMLRDEFAAVTSRGPAEVGNFRVRPPVRPVKISRLGGEDV
jgi:Fe-S-cluster-containing hydrogenase component 2/bacterioferritin-associated ferredoxin